jgi:CheY-like chemotaxis protein
MTYRSALPRARSQHWLDRRDPANRPETRALLPDLILVDVSMPGMNGFEAPRLIRKEVPQTTIIIIMSQNDPVQLLPSVIAAGGNGCVDKSRLATDLLMSIIRSICMASEAAREDQPPES